MRIYRNITELIGGTPLLELTNYERKNDLNAAILAKLEYLNPAGSVKDRIARAMIDAAEASGELKPDSVIIEPTSGNTGIGLAAGAHMYIVAGAATALTLFGLEVLTLVFGGLGRRRTMIVFSASMKPMPLTTCAAMRLGSRRSPSWVARKSSNPYCETIIISALPSATRK